MELANFHINQRQKGREGDPWKATVWFLSTREKKTEMFKRVFNSKYPSVGLIMNPRHLESRSHTLSHQLWHTVIALRAPFTSQLAKQWIILFFLSLLSLSIKKFACWNLHEIFLFYFIFFSLWQGVKVTLWNCGSLQRKGLVVCREWEYWVKASKNNNSSNTNKALTPPLFNNNVWLFMSGCYVAKSLILNNYSVTTQYGFSANLVKIKVF